MSAQSEAFSKALADLSTRFTAKLVDLNTQIEAAKAAQAAQDDAAFKDATDQLTALSASLGDHVDAIAQVSGGAAGVTAPVTTAPIDVPADSDLIRGAVASMDDSIPAVVSVAKKE